MRKPTRPSIVAMTAAAVGSFVAPSVKAAIITPSGLQPGDAFRLVFVSNSTTDALSSDPTGYDTLVATDAAAAGVDTYNGNPVTWQTLASFDGGPSAVGRFNPTSPIFLLNGNKVADNAADLWDSTIQTAINLAPDGSTVSGNVWTGSANNGNEFNIAFGSKALGNTNDVNFEGQEIGVSATIGDSTSITSSWINFGGDSPDTELPLYAFSSELTVPGPVPEPATAGLVAAGVALLASRRNTKRK